MVDPEPRYERVASVVSPRGEVVLRHRRAAGTARGSSPDGSARDGCWELRVNGVFVMDDVETASERALAAVALDAVDTPSSVLVGGLGFGHTLARVLAEERVRRVVVVELEEALVGWMRDGTVPFGPAVLADGRVDVVVADLADVLATAAPASHDVVLLDVDNGPGHLVHDANARLYEAAALRATLVAVRPGGAAAWWSSHPPDGLVDRLSRLGAVPRVHGVVGERDGRRSTNWLVVAGIGRRAPGDR